MEHKGPQIKFSAFVENMGDAPAEGVSVALKVPEGITAAFIVLGSCGP